MSQRLETQGMFLVTLVIPMWILKVVGKCEHVVRAQSVVATLSSPYCLVRKRTNHVGQLKKLYGMVREYNNHIE